MNELNKKIDYIEKYSKQIDFNNDSFLKEIPEEAKTKEFWLSIVLRNWKFMDKIPEHYLTDELVIKLIEKNYCLLNDYVFDIFKKYLNQNICNKLVEEKPYLINSIPTKFITKDMLRKYEIDEYKFNMLKDEFKDEEMCLIASKTLIHISAIPKKYRTKEICTNIVFNNPKELINMPEEFIDNELLCSLIEKFGSKGIDYIPTKYLSKELYSIAFNKVFEINPNYYYFKSIPKEYVTDEIWKKVIKFKPAAMRYLEKDLPVDLLTDEFLLEIIKDNPTCMKYIPSKKITKELLYKVIDIDPTYLKCVPKNFIDEDLKNHTKIATLKTSSEIIKGLSELSTKGGSIESLAKEYKIPIYKINYILELLKDADPNLYNQIKGKLANNQAIWVDNMVEECNRFAKIIMSLGHIDNFLSREQKIKFAYLYNKESNNALEKVYIFNNKYPDKIENSNLINMFFRKVLKYNHLSNDDTMIPEKKTIEYNNRWLKKFDKYDYFKIVDGIPTAKNQYLEHVITVEDVDKILKVLKENNIPLNDMIVKEAIRSFYNNNLHDYIEMLQSYESEITKHKTK